MRRNAIGTFIFSLCTLFGPLLGQQIPLYVPLRPQLSSNWCWAASAQMAMEALGANQNTVRQRIQAGRSYLPPESCYSNACSSGSSGGSTSPTCAFNGFPQFYKFGFEADVTPLYRPLKWSELQQELGCRPVVFAREDLKNGQRLGTGHMVVATSAAIIDNTPWIAVNDPGPPCDGSARPETYYEYLGGTNQAHWIDYYNLHQTGTALAQCAPLGPKPPVFEIRESTSPQALVAGFIAAIQNDTWIRKSAGLVTGFLNCDLESAIPEKRISIDSLRNAAPDASLDSLIFDVGRLRFLCFNGDSQKFSVEIEQQKSSLWRVSTIGDIQLATRLQAIQANKQVNQQIQEVLVLGLNIRFARLVGSPPGLAIPLSSVPGYDIAPIPKSESTFLDQLRKAAISFRVTGPT